MYNNGKLDDHSWLQEYNTFVNLGKKTIAYVLA